MDDIRKVQNFHKSLISSAFSNVDEIEKARRKPAKGKFEVGEISPTTGLQKKPDGSWGPVEGKGKPKGEEEEGGIPESVMEEAREIINASGPKTNKVRKLNRLGLSVEQMVAVSDGEIGLSYARHLHNEFGLEEGDKFDDLSPGEVAAEINPSSNAAKQARREAKVLSARRERDVKTMVKIYRTKIKTVALGLKKALIVYGTGGLGKSYNLLDVLENEMKQTQYDPEVHDLGSDDYDFVIIKGKTGEKDIYQKLFEHNGKNIVFDDADEAVKASASGSSPTINLLKAALDTGEKTYVSHPAGDIKTSKVIPGQEPDKNDMYTVPNTYRFQGTFVAITNLPPDKMPQPIIQSRALDMDMSMDRDETLDLMEQIAPSMVFYDSKGDELDIPPQTVKDAVAFIRTHADTMPIGRMNARTLQNVAVLKFVTDMQGDDTMDWRDLAEDELYD